MQEQSAENKVTAIPGLFQQSFVQLFKGEFSASADISTLILSSSVINLLTSFQKHSENYCYYEETDYFFRLLPQIFEEKAFMIAFAFM